MKKFTILELIVFLDYKKEIIIIKNNKKIFKGKIPEEDNLLLNRKISNSYIENDILYIFI